MAIKVKINDTLYNKDVSGKLIFLFSQDTTEQLIFGVNPYNPQPVFTYDIQNWNPKDTIVINKFTDEWYKKFTDLEGAYACRVILDINTEERSSFVARGNGYSRRLKHFIEALKKDTLLFEVNNKFEGWIFTESDAIKEVKLRSNLLSEFWGRDIFIQSALVLPENFDKANKSYTLVFVFPGFGSSHTTVTYGTGQIDRYGMNTVGQPKVFIFMNGEFFQGYHHFTDSENNGPWGKAFIEEFIPYIDTLLGISAGKPNRYLMGQSSGAWTALWLQINYPEKFEQSFIASPDPIDFRAYGNNVYKINSNYYFPENADSTEITKANKEKLFAQLEDVLGEFGQIRTWEATYSPRTEDGEIAHLFNRESGIINNEAARKWAEYDISRIIRENPEKYRLIASEKIHIFVSNDDPYGLNRSIILFDNMLKENNICADIHYYDSLGHNVCGLMN